MGLSVCLSFFLSTWLRERPARSPMRSASEWTRRGLSAFELVANPSINTKHKNNPGLFPRPYGDSLRCATSWPNVEPPCSCSRHGKIHVAVSLVHIAVSRSLSLPLSRSHGRPHLSGLDQYMKVSELFVHSETMPNNSRQREKSRKHSSFRIPIKKVEHVSSTRTLSVSSPGLPARSGAEVLAAAAASRALPTLRLLAWCQR